jgi:thiol-disulfide isomerase/thioredoxin
MRPTVLLISTCLAAALVACGRDPGPTRLSTPVVATPSDVPRPAAAEVDRARPVLRIATLDGAPYDLGTRRGNWVVVNFWATWCAPCIKEMPELDALDRRRDDLEVIGLAYEDITPEDMRVFLSRRPVSYPIALVDVNDPPAGFDTPRGLPMTHLIAPDGRLAKSFLGPVTAAEIDAAIANRAPAS